jgi:hypothetical protein
MADQVSDQVFAYNAPTGWKLETSDPPEAVFTVSEGLTPADDHRLTIARQYFREVNERDYEHQGKNWVNRATGEHLRRVRFDPSLSEDPATTCVTVFFITHDGYLLYLRPVGTESRSKTVVQGSVGVVGT